jgi:hypothetical protein
LQQAPAIFLSLLSRGPWTAIRAKIRLSGLPPALNLVTLPTVNEK